MLQYVCLKKYELLNRPSKDAELHTIPTGPHCAWSANWPSRLPHNLFFEISVLFPKL